VICTRTHIRTHETTTTTTTGRPYLLLQLLNLRVEFVDIVEQRKVLILHPDELSDKFFGIVDAGGTADFLKCFLVGLHTLGRDLTTNVVSAQGERRTKATNKQRERHT
jgi:hypothetical protein